MGFLQGSMLKILALDYFVFVGAPCFSGHVQSVADQHLVRALEEGKPLLAVYLVERVQPRLELTLIRWGSFRLTVVTKEIQFREFLKRLEAGIEAPPGIRPQRKGCEELARALSVWLLHNTSAFTSFSISFQFLLVLLAPTF
ncbi:hypothetical protein [Microbulbifer sp. JMSA008]|uniref:hypothetical protein n=1 Tax=Microbulbifer sp. JMSA008 TaxID=3243373 RepID=UPI004039CA42